MNLKSLTSLLFLSGLVFTIIPLAGNETPCRVFEIRFESHRFTPQSLFIPAGQEVRLKVVNASPERIEFESYKLNREKVVEPGKTITVNLEPLQAGRYDFYDDFHADVPEGEIVAR